MKKVLPLMLLISSLAADVASKAWAIHGLAGSSVSLLKGFLRFRLVYNTGGFWGVLQGHKTLFLIVALATIALLAAYYIYEKNKNAVFECAAGLLLSGALGNIVDRLVPGRPGVVDFISVGIDGVYRWPLFNIADMCVITGCGLLFVHYLKTKDKISE